VLSAETYGGRFFNQSVSYRLRVNPPLSRKLGVESLGTFHPITYVGFHPAYIASFYNRRRLPA